MEHTLQKSLFKAECLQSKKPFQSLYELDLSLWSFFQSCAKKDEQFTARSLSISENVIHELRYASPAKLSKISSGVFISFSLGMETSSLLNNISCVLKQYEDCLPGLLLENSRSAQDLTVMKTERYWRVMRDLAIFNGAGRAALAFDVDYEVAQSISKLSDAQILNLALRSSINFKLRFSEKTLLELLTREQITHHSLVRYQQILTNYKKSAGANNTENTEKNIVDRRSRPIPCGNDIEGLEEQPKPYSLKSHAPLWVKAKQLTVIGLITKAVTIETGITQKQMVRLKKELLDDGVDLPSTATKLRSGGLVRDYISSIQASVLMLAYYRYGGEAIKKNIDIDALGSALMLFHKIRYEAEMNEFRWKPIDSNAGYSLARELRGSGEATQAYFESCPCCKLTIFTSTNQTVRPEDRCPFCRIKEAKKIRAV